MANKTEFDFTGKVVVVTGAESGVGRAVALLFAESGAQVVVAGRDSKAVLEVGKQCEEVSPKGLQALEVVADLRQRPECRRLIHTTVKVFERLDVLVNNTAGDTHPMVDITEEDYLSVYKDVLDSILDPLICVTHYSVPYLQKTGGNIINVDSQQTGVKISPYCMAKSSVDVFTKSIAKELQSKGIRVNSINMGQVVDSELTRKAGPQVVSKQDKSSGGRAPDGHNMGQSVLYLASNEARFITGSVLSADGDWLSANINLMAITH